MENLTNLKDAITSELVKEHTKRLNSIDKLTGINQIFDSWQFSELLTKLRQEQVKSGLLSLADAKFLMTGKLAKNYKKEFEKQVGELESIENLDHDFISATVTIEWGKGSCKANQAKASMKVETSQYYQYYEGNKTTGYGYDKESTAMKDVLNACPSLLKLMYAYKNKNIKVDNRELFGYGLNGGLLPSFSYGVGVSCYYGILDKIGLQLKKTAEGKTFDVYTIEKKKG